MPSKPMKWSLGIVLLLLPFLACPHRSLAAESEERPKRTSVFNERWLDTVVSIEQQVPRERLAQMPDQERQEISKAGGYRAIGTGFLVETEKHHIILVTARHVIQDKVTKQPLTDLGYRLNEQEGPSRMWSDTFIQERGLGPWFISPTEDVACRFVGRSETTRLATIPPQMFLSQQGLQAGAGLLVLGFPFGRRSPEQAVPIARRGTVARSDPGLIIADAFVFPGNSGGPVIYVPVVKIGEPFVSPLINEERLVGVVSGYIPYKEPAISPQTGNIRIMFEENSGLTNIVPVDALLELLNREDLRNLDQTLQ